MILHVDAFVSFVPSMLFFQSYLAALAAMTEGLPPTALTLSGETGAVISVQM